MTPVHLITGFLGSGKTTLLRGLLADPALADTAVLINEFGEVGLDHLLLERVDETMVLLKSGCLCCTIREELAEALKGLLSRRERGLVPPFRRVVIESTGLADPFPILTTLKADPVLRHQVHLGTVVTTLDAVNAPAQMERQFESIRQIAAADRLVITKADLAGDVTALTARVQAINPEAPLLIKGVDAVDEGALFGPQPGRPRRFLPVPASAESVHAEVRSFVVERDEALDWTVFGLWLTLLLNRHGDAILRIKGILHVRGWDGPVAIHGVQHLMHPPEHLTPEHHEGWVDGDRRSRIVFIVKGLDPALIERSLQAFLTLNDDY